MHERHDSLVSNSYDLARCRARVEMLEAQLLESNKKLISAESARRKVYMNTRAHALV